MALRVSSWFWALIGGVLSVRLQCTDSACILGVAAAAASSCAAFGRQWGGSAAAVQGRRKAERLRPTAAAMPAARCLRCLYISGRAMAARREAESNKKPTQQLMCTMGPSLPRERPLPTARDSVSSFTVSTRGDRKLLSRRPPINTFASAIPARATSRGSSSSRQQQHSQSNRRGQKQQATHHRQQAAHYTKAKTLK